MTYELSMATDFADGMAPTGEERFPAAREKHLKIVDWEEEPDAGWMEDYQ